MRPCSIRVALFELAALAITFTPAQSRAQQSARLPPVRQLGPRVAISADSLGSVSGLHQLVDGQVLINDVVRRRLVLYDSGLRKFRIVADSTPTTNKAYGTPLGGIIAYRGDSTLFVDPTSISLSVLDPAGKPVRVIAPPQPGEIYSLLALVGNGAVFDGHGRLVYASLASRMRVTGNLPGLPPPPPPPPLNLPATGIPPHDSTPLLRADLATHVVDTLGFLLRSVSVPPHMDRDADGNMLMTMAIYPISVTDEWTMLSDGTIALVRASDYHVDWIAPDGAHTTTPKIAHEWTRMSDSAKQAILDSTHHVIDSLQTQIQTQIQRAVAVGGGRGAGPGTVKVAINGVELSDIPDYAPPFSAGAVRADLENNLWIREGASALSTAVQQTYDVVNRGGVLIDRVQLPPSLSLVGFGPGVVYLTSREGTGVVLVKYRIH